MPNCENCGKEAELYSCIIVNSLGTRHRDICEDCIVALSADGHVELEGVQKDLPGRKPDESAREKISNVKITTGPSFEGYKIVEYKDIVFDESISGIGWKTSLKSIGDIFASLTGEQMHAVTERMNELKLNMINSLKAKAALMGANGIIAVDFETTMPGGSTIMVSANGTAVVIEKKEQED